MKLHLKEQASNIYYWDELTPDQQGYVVQNWFDMDELAQYIDYIYKDYSRAMYEKKEQRITDHYTKRYGLGIHSDKLYWEERQQEPYYEWDLSQVFDIYQLSDGTEIRFYGDDNVVYADAELWGETVESPKVDKIVDHAQDYINNICNLIDQVCKAYPDDDWVFERMKNDPTSFKFSISDSGDISFVYPD